VIDVFVLLLVILPPLDWAAAMILGVLALRNPHVITLRERAFAAGVLAVAASAAGILAWARMGLVDIERDVATLILALILVAISAPALYWLALLLSGGFRDGRP